MSVGAAGAVAPPPVGTPAPAGGTSSNIFGSYNSSGGTSAPTATGTVGGTNQIAPPSAATSAYEYQYVTGAQIVLGPQMAQLLGLNATATYTGQQVMQAFLDAPSSAMQALEQDLYAAGMYANTANEQPSTGIVTGQLDNNAFMAMSQAILMVSNVHGETLSGYLAQQQLSGAGQARIEKALQPITGGGNAYQVNLTSPTDVYATAMQIFQQYLGRNPTQAELDQIVGQVQGQEKQYQQAQIGQTEAQSEAKYQQQIASRNAVMTPQAATSGSTGYQVPNGPFQSPGQYAVSLLQALNFPVTTSNVSLLISWIAANGGLNGAGKNNPLGVQQTAPGGTPSKGAQNFATPAQGIQAAMNLLSSPQYQALFGALGSGRGAEEASNPAVKAELGQWSGGNASNLNTKSATAAAQQAVTEYTRSTASPAANAAPQAGMSGNNRAIGGLAPGGNINENQAVQNTLEAGATNPQVGAYLQAQQQAAQANSGASPTNLPAANTGPNQGLASPGDQYLPANVLTETQAPSPTSVATEAATTGANRVPYLGQQFLDAYQAILNLIQTPLKG